MTWDEAQDSILATFQTAWNAQTAAVVGYVPGVRWPDNREPAELPKNKFWARVSCQVVTTRQTSLAEPGDRRFSAAGLVIVQLFGPAARPSAGKELRGLGAIAKSAFQGVSNSDGVWFRNANLAPLSSEAEWLRYNVTSEFVYDERG